MWLERKRNMICLYSTACVYALTALNLAVYAIPLLIVAYLFIKRVIEAPSRLLKKRCNDASPLSDWKCRALCLPIWSTLAQSGGYADQSGQLDEIVGRHRQGELEVELPNAT